MRRILCAVLGLWLALGPSARADEAQTPPAPHRSVVVELFTSQGCSSCPPADDLLGRIAKNPGVIALAYHVDYWDYIGWKDQFAKPEFTARQKAYAEAARNRSVYTPQMIVEGEARVVGYKPKELAALIARFGAMPAPAEVTLARAGDRLSVSATAAQPFAAPAAVLLVRYLPERRVTISRGENAGRTLDYHNIVTRIDRIGDWDGRGPYRAELGIAGDEPAVVLIQAPGPGPILGAAVATED